MSETTAGFYPHSYFHLGLVVPDIEAAMAQLGPALGLTFNPTHVSVYGEDTITVTYAREGPPYLEFIQGEPGSKWNTSAGPRPDHVGYFSHDLDGDAAALEAAGLPVDIDGRQYGRPFTYHRAADAGLRVELVGEKFRETLMAMILG